MTRQEARDDEREALERVLFNGLHRGLTAHEIVTTILREGYRKHPEFEMTDEMIRRAALAMYQQSHQLSMAGATVLARAALTSAGPWAPLVEEGAG